MDIINVITKEQNLRREQAQAVIRLIDEGNTIPFIARYRKEQHGNMSDEQLRALTSGSGICARSMKGGRRFCPRSKHRESLRRSFVKRSGRR